MNDFEWGMKAHNAVNEMDRDIPGLSGPTITFMTGAKWQREQLRTDEAIEKAADILSFQTTGGCYPKADEQCRHVMRQVLTALLGED